jgi:hypothetical protein
MILWNFSSESAPRSFNDAPAGGPHAAASILILGLLRNSSLPRNHLRAGRLEIEDIDGSSSDLRPDSSDPLAAPEYRSNDSPRGWIDANAHEKQMTVFECALAWRAECRSAKSASSPRLAEACRRNPKRGSDLSGRPRAYGWRH